jgi:hypothetical protein
MAMTPQTPSLPRVSILARVLPAIPCLIVMLGAAANAILLMGVMNAMRNAESAGIGAVATGLAQAQVAIVFAFYLAIFVTAISIIVMAVRSFIATKTVSPSGWFILIIALLGGVPVSLAWKAHTLLLGSIMNRVGIVTVASTIQLCSILVLITAGLFSVVLLVASLAPLPSALRAKRSWAPIIVLVLMEVALIVLAVVFQMNMAWLQGVAARESF